MFKHISRNDDTGMVEVSDLAKGRVMYVVGCKDQLISAGLCKEKLFAFSGPESAILFYVYDCRRGKIIRAAQTESDALIWVANRKEEVAAS